MDSGLHCGGTIVTSNRVITAAHCFILESTNKPMEKSDLKRFKIVAGTDRPFENVGKFYDLVLNPPLPKVVLGCTDSCVAITIQESGARLHEPGKTLVSGTY